MTHFSTGRPSPDSIYSLASRADELEISYAALRCNAGHDYKACICPYGDCLGFIILHAMVARLADYRLKRNCWHGMRQKENYTFPSTKAGIPWVAR